MTVRFRPGQFYGVRHDRTQGGIFELGVLEANAPEHDVHLHLHEEAHFVLVLAGTYISSAHGAPSLAPAPALVYNPPGTVHRDRFLGGKGRFMTISIEPARLDAGDALHRIPTFSSYLQHAACLRTAFSLARGMQGRPDVFLLEAGVWELLAHTDTRPGVAVRRPPSWMRHAYGAVMDGAVDPGLSIADVAASSGVHPVHLARVFRELFGCSPGELLRWRRIERACAMLRQQGRSVAEVALDAGFVDQSHMSHAFRQRFGMPPGAWRRRMFDGYKTAPPAPD
ncbi:AraC family transcriptional regulator [Massilia sp. CFBP9026]|uniref:helix-turn-helix transcriptional regulator n=1 Tax=Massilia sp. CFBP9026 TaxID=3096536 RepID=UPI002A6AEB39|nr:AraC family transcriptional regulator [Massilia sp. CFBP9026]MDY0962790.1 AraC family transcriptional regulator [Massilia sp. CFBP9026]